MDGITFLTTFRNEYPILFFTGRMREEVVTGSFEKGADGELGRTPDLVFFIVREILAIPGMTIRENGVVGRGARFGITVPGGMYRKDAGKS